MDGGRTGTRREPVGLLPPSKNKNHLKTQNLPIAESSDFKYRWDGSSAMKSKTCPNDPSALFCIFPNTSAEGQRFSVLLPTTIDLRSKSLGQVLKSAVLRRTRRVGKSAEGAGEPPTRHSSRDRKILIPRTSTYPSGAGRAPAPVQE